MISRNSSRSLLKIYLKNDALTPSKRPKMMGYRIVRRKPHKKPNKRLSGPNLWFNVQRLNHLQKLENFEQILGIKARQLTHWYHLEPLQLQRLFY